MPASPLNVALTPNTLYALNSCLITEMTLPSKTKAGKLKNNSWNSSISKIVPFGKVKYLNSLNEQ